MDRLRVVLLAAVFGAVAACDGGGWLDRTGVLSFREVDATGAREIVADDAGVLIHVTEVDSSSPPLAGARHLDAGEPIPAELVDESGSVVIVSDEIESARRLAARMLRAGVPRVSVVRGGVEAWLAVLPDPNRRPSAARRRAASKT